jgi:hypothetical protein
MLVHEGELLVGHARHKETHAIDRAGAKLWEFYDRPLGEWFC